MKMPPELWNMPKSKIKNVRLRSANVLTLKEAEEERYGTVNSIKKQILRGAIPADKVGNNWLVHRKDLELMVKRKQRWLEQRNKNTNN